MLEPEKVLNLENFRIGDVVARKNGGPAMTVNDMTDQHIICVWFEGMNYFMSGFRPDEIESARLVFRRQIAELDRLGVPHAPTRN